MVSNLFNVQHQLIFYGAYHHNKTNVRIHMFCVPVLLVTAQVFLARLPLPAVLVDLRASWATLLSGSAGAYLARMSWEGVLFAVYQSYYFVLEPIAAMLYAPQLIASTFLANYMAYDVKAGLTIALVAHVVCWIAQFIGHGVYEKRAPALLDNLLGALVLAPFFVHLELLFSLGYNKTLNDQVDRGVLKEIGKIRAREKKKV